VFDPPGLEIEYINPEDEDKPKFDKVIVDSHYAPGYKKNTGLPVFEDPKASILTNPPELRYHYRETEPGMPPLPRVPYPSFHRNWVINCVIIIIIIIIINYANR